MLDFSFSPFLFLVFEFCFFGFYTRRMTFFIFILSPSFSTSTYLLILEEGPLDSRPGNLICKALEIYLDSPLSFFTFYCRYLVIPQKPDFLKKSKTTRLTTVNEDTHTHTYPHTRTYTHPHTH